MSDQFSDSDRLLTALQEHFGLTSFRPLQREIITEVLAGRSAMAVLPTGGGKSLCYQLPALMLQGVTLVISPLISLMKDQVDGLTARGIAAVAINSQDSPAEGRHKLELLATGQVRLAYVAPERLRNTAFLEACGRAGISLLAVDEAHCISQWGHDFRPDYRYIREFHESIGAPPLLALTATARHEVRADIVAHLGISQEQVFSAGSDRSNLWLGLERCATVAEKRAKVAYLARNAGGSTIVYVTSRKDAESFAEMLEKELAEPVDSYHAGLTPTQRSTVQNRFMAGECRVVVATNAFGMGIDKSDIRAVIHAGVPESLEAYFQEIGRAGRDGLPAACTMVLVPGMDVKRREYLLGREQPDSGTLEALFRRLKGMARGNVATLYPSEDDEALILPALSHLQSLGAAELVQRNGEGLEVRILDRVSAALADEVRLRMAEQEQIRWERFREMRSFVYLGNGCRRTYLLRYFGEVAEPAPDACCSSCHPRPLPEGLAPIASKSSKAKGRGRKNMRDAATALTASPPPPDESSQGDSHSRLPRAEMLALTGAMFATGATVAEVAVTLNRAESTIFQYLLQWLTEEQSGAWKPVVRRVITPNDYRAIRRAIQADSSGSLKAIHEFLEGQYTYEQLRVARTVMEKTGDGLPDQSQN